MSWWSGGAGSGGVVGGGKIWNPAYWFLQFIYKIIDFVCKFDMTMFCDSIIWEGNIQKIKGKPINTEIILDI